MTALPAGAEPACADEYELVDLAWGGSAEANQAKRLLATRFCAHCPVQQECLEVAIATDSYGPWAGTDKSYVPGSTRKSTLKGTQHGTAPHLPREE